MELNVLINFRERRSCSSTSASSRCFARVEIVPEMTAAPMCRTGRQSLLAHSLVRASFEAWARQSQRARIFFFWATTYPLRHSGRVVRHAAFDAVFTCSRCALRSLHGAAAVYATASALLRKRAIASCHSPQSPAHRSPSFKCRASLIKLRRVVSPSNVRQTTATGAASSSLSRVNKMLMNAENGWPAYCRASVWPLCLRASCPIGVNSQMHATQLLQRSAVPRSALSPVVHILHGSWWST